MFCRRSTPSEPLNFSSTTLILTVNRRLSVTLSRRHAKEKLAAGEKTWPSLSIFPLNQWLESTFKNTYPEQTLLTPHMESELWLEIIENDPQTPPLLQPASLVQQVQSAWQLLHLWQVPRDYLVSPETTEITHFQRWLNQFESLCAKNAYLTGAQLPQWVTENVLSKLNSQGKPENGNIRETGSDALRKAKGDAGRLLGIALEKLIITGFDDLSTAHRALITAFEKHIPVEALIFEASDPQCAQLRLQNTQDEVHQMALWAKHQLEEDAHRQITCVVPDLNTLRDEIDWQFKEILTPQHFLNHTQPDAPLFNISAAKKLTSYPMIATAMDALHFACNPIPLEQAAKFFQSPYLCPNEMDKHCSAMLDLTLRDTQCAHVPHALVFKALNTVNAIYPNNTWVSRWRAYTQHLQSNTNPRTTQQWAEYFLTLLEAIGWPQGRTLNSLEHQLLQRFQELLIEFSKLDLIYTSCNYTTALQRLKRFLHGIDFQPEGSIAPIQILGLLESAGNHSDALWMMQTDDEHWPSAADPNPFIPFELQRSLKLPRSTPKRESDYSHALLHRLTQSASQIILSSAQFHDSRPCVASTAIESIPETTLEAIGVIPVIPPATEPSRLETREDNWGTRVDGAVTIGGSAVIGSQSLCPFQAFARHRLKARSLKKSVDGISSQERGTWTHLALLSIWKKIKDHATLATLSSGALKALVSESIRNTQPPFQYRNNHYYIALERQRLEKLLLAWLAFEGTRKPFEVVACEKNETIQIGPLKLRIQVDRIDQSEGKRKTIIDYKTGRTSINVWFGDRPRDPQLPLYCSFIEDTDSVQGIAFAELRAGSLKFTGYSAKSDEEWKEQVKHWKTQLTHLAENFHAGHAEVDPLDTNIACTYCDLHGLCRIGEKNSILLELDPETQKTIRETT